MNVARSCDTGVRLGEDVGILRSTVAINRACRVGAFIEASVLARMGAELNSRANILYCSRVMIRVWFDYDSVYVGFPEVIYAGQFAVQI